MPTQHLTGPTPVNLRNRRSIIGDALRMQGLIMREAEKPEVGPMALSSLASALCRLIPIVMALRGKTLMVSGTVSRKLDVSTKDAMKQLRAVSIDLDKLTEGADEEQPKESLKSMPKGDRRVGGEREKRGTALLKPRDHT